MKKYLIRYTRSGGIIAIMPIGEGIEVFGTNKYILSTLEEAKIMLTALGVDVKPLEEYQEPEELEG